MLDLSPGALYAGGSALAFMALGLAVWRWGPATPANRALAAFAILFGYGFVAYNLVADDVSWKPLTTAAEAVAFAGATAAFLMLVRYHARPGAAGWVAVALLAGAFALPSTLADAGAVVPGAAAYARNTVVLPILQGVEFGAAVAFALRYVRTAPAARAERRRRARMTIARTAYAPGPAPGMFHSPGAH
ncbi:MAG: hypothetical protein ACT4PT_08665, partial [Methanobacteriota archaeon]